jgi:hypothetical protein
MSFSSNFHRVGMSTKPASKFPSANKLDSALSGRVCNCKRSADQAHAAVYRSSTLRLTQLASIRPSGPIFSPCIKWASFSFSFRASFLVIPIWHLLRRELSRHVCCAIFRIGRPNKNWHFLFYFVFVFLFCFLLFIKKFETVLNSEQISNGTNF